MFTADLTQTLTFDDVVSQMLAICDLVQGAGGTENEEIAALLRDAVEKQRHSPRQTPLLDEKIRDIVAALATGETLPSPQRESIYIESVRTGNSAVKLLSCADHLHTFRCYAATGKDLWTLEVSGFYAELMAIYAECDRIPRHWLTEMKQLICQIENEQINQSAAAAMQLQKTDW